MIWPHCDEMLMLHFECIMFRDVDDSLVVGKLVGLFGSSTWLTMAKT